MLRQMLSHGSQEETNILKERLLLSLIENVENEMHEVPPTEIERIQKQLFNIFTQEKNTPQPIVEPVGSSMKLSSISCEIKRLEELQNKFSILMKK
jgi:hypothetical protein